MALSDIRLSEIEDQQLREQLYDLWIAEGVLVFEGAQGVETQLALSRIFGPLQVHPIRESISGTAREFRRPPTIEAIRLGSQAIL